MYTNNRKNNPITDTIYCINRDVWIKYTPDEANSCVHIKCNKSGTYFHVVYFSMMEAEKKQTFYPAFNPSC